MEGGAQRCKMSHLRFVRVDLDEIMLNFYHQVGYSGMFILLLGLIAIFMAIRGVVLIELIKRQAPHSHSIVQQIVETTQAKSQLMSAPGSASAQTSARASNQDSDKASDKTSETAETSKTSETSETSGNSRLAPLSEGISEIMVNTLMQVQMKGVYSSMHFLKLCAAIGPLLGLLGTVLGMVDVFSTLSSRSMPDPSLLAGGIWEALLTTVMGLTLAIPALIVHYYLLMNLRALRNRINLMLCHVI